MSMLHPRFFFAVGVTLALALVGLASCTSQSAHTTTSSSASSIEVLGGEDVISIYLDYRAGTGYEWQCTFEPEGAIGIAYEHDISASGNSSPPEPIDGGSMQHVVTMRAMKPGHTTLTCALVRPWEKDAEPAEVQTFVFTVDSDLHIDFDNEASTYEHTPERGSNS